MVIDHEYLVFVPDLVDAEVFQIGKPVSTGRVHLAPDILTRLDRTRAGMRREDLFRNSHTHGQLLCVLGCVALLQLINFR